MPQSCPAFDQFFLAARDALLPEEPQKMLPPVSEAVKYGDRRGGLSFQPAREDINQGLIPCYQVQMTILLDFFSIY